MRIGIGMGGKEMNVQVTCDQKQQFECVACCQKICLHPHLQQNKLHLQQYVEELQKQKLISKMLF